MRMWPWGRLRTQRPMVALLYKALALSVSGSPQAFLLLPMRQGIRPAGEAPSFGCDVPNPDDQPTDAG